MMGGTIKQASTWFSGNSLHSGSCWVQTSWYERNSQREDIRRSECSICRLCWGEWGRDAS